MHPTESLLDFVVNRLLDGVIAGIIVMVIFLRLDDGSLLQLLKNNSDGLAVFALLAVMLCSLFATAMVGLALSCNSACDEFPES